MARALLVALAALACFLGGCRGCGQGPLALAVLVERHGEASHERGGAPGAWTDAPIGEKFGIGDALRTVTGSNANVTLSSGGGLRLGESTTVRFLGQGATTRRIGVETGEAEVESGDTALSLETSVGLAQIEPGSRVHVTSAAGLLKFEVLVGRAQLEGDGGPVKAVAGQRFLVSLGKVTLEPIEAAHPDAGAPDKKLPEKNLPDAATVAADATPLLDATPASALAHVDGSAPVDAPGLEEVVAEVHGDGVRTGLAGSSARAALAPGSARLAGGTLLDLPAGASVDLTRGGERVSMVGRSEVEIGKAGEALVHVRSGRLLLRSRTVGRRIDVPGGSIVLATVGTGDVQAEVEVDNAGTRVVSNQGELQLRGTGSSATIAPGQTGKLDPRGKATVEEPPPTAADVTIDAGESPVVHSPRGQASVRVRFPACAGEGILQVTTGGVTHRTFARGEGTATAVMSLPGGSHRYTVRCVGGTETRADQGGSITVLRDSGAARVVRTAPVNVVDTDGRRYSILYQNLLPQMTFRWPHAPADGAVSLHVEHAGASAQKFPATAGKVSLPSGAIREGSYSAWFDADGHPEVRSPETTIRIAFDNAAPAAEIQLPVDGQPATPTVHVSGVAAEGSTVTVGGTSIPMDPQSRFEGDAPAPPPGDRSLAVRISHAVHGIHYYVRMFAPQSDAPPVTGAAPH